jgi:multidrug efflux pump subunit AcrA (membrane-fusion protein)
MIEIRASVDGKISVLVKMGETVKKGDPLARIYFYGSSVRQVAPDDSLIDHISTADGSIVKKNDLILVLKNFTAQPNTIS